MSAQKFPCSLLTKGEAGLLRSQRQVTLNIRAGKGVALLYEVVSTTAPKPAPLFLYTGKEGTSLVFSFSPQPSPLSLGSGSGSGSSAPSAHLTIHFPAPKTGGGVASTFILELKVSQMEEIKALLLALPNTKLFIPPPPPPPPASLALPYRARPSSQQHQQQQQQLSQEPPSDMPPSQQLQDVPKEASTIPPAPPLRRESAKRGLEVGGGGVAGIEESSALAPTEKRSKTGGGGGSQEHTQATGDGASPSRSITFPFQPPGGGERGGEGGGEGEGEGVGEGGSMNEVLEEEDEEEEEEVEMEEKVEGGEKEEEGRGGRVTTIDAATSMSPPGSGGGRQPAPSADFLTSPLFTVGGLKAMAGRVREGLQTGGDASNTSAMALALFCEDDSFCSLVEAIREALLLGKDEGEWGGE